MGNETVKKRKPIKSAQSSKLLQWLTGAQRLDPSLLNVKEKGRELLPR